MEMYNLTEEEKNEIVKYGLKRFRSSICFFVFVLFMGIVCGVFVKGLIFWISFCTIRQYAGGYHADTQKRCSIISVGVIVLLFTGMKYITMNESMCVLLQVSAYVIIMLFSPVDNKNRVLDSIDRKKFRRKARIMATVLLVVSYVVYRFWGVYLLIPIVMAYMVVAISLMAGMYKNFYESKTKKYKKEENFF